MNQFEILPFEMVLEILYYMDYETIINFSKSNKLIYEYINFTDFWEKRAFNDYGIESNIFNKDLNKNYLTRYNEISKNIKIIIITSKSCSHNNYYQINMRLKVIEEIKKININIIELHIDTFKVDMIEFEKTYNIKLPDNFNNYVGFFPRFLLFSKYKLNILNILLCDKSEGNFFLSLYSQDDKDLTFDYSKKIPYTIIDIVKWIKLTI